LIFSTIFKQLGMKLRKWQEQYQEQLIELKNRRNI